MILPLFSALMKPQWEYCTQFCGPQYRKGMDLLKWLQSTSTKMVRGLKHLLLGGKPESWGCSVWRSPPGRPYCDLSKGGLKDEQRFTAKACSDRTGSKGFKCKFIRVLLHWKISSYLIRFSDFTFGTGLVSCSLNNVPVFWFTLLMDILLN